MSRRVAVAVVIAVLLAGVTGAAAPAAAQTNESVLGDVFSDDDASDRAETWARAVWASRSRAGFWIQSQLPGFLTDAVPSLAPDRQTAEDEIAAVASFYNANNETLEAYVNERATVSSNKTVKVTLHLRGETAKRYLLVDVANDSIASSEVVSSTDRTITDRVTVCGYAADQSLEELKRFTDDFAEPNEDVTREYLAELAGKYGSDVETTLIDSSGECEDV